MTNPITQITAALAMLATASAANAQPGPMDVPSSAGCKAIAVTPTACLEGRLRLIRAALGRPISDLEREELGGFAKSYRQLIAAFNGAGDDVQEALRETGYAQAQLELATAELETVANHDAQTSVVKLRLAPSAENLSQLKAQARTKLQALHENYQRQPEPAQLDQMAMVAQRIQDMQRLEDAIATAEQPEHQAKDLEQPFQLVAGEMRDEVRLATEHARLMGELVVEASQEMDTALRYLQAESRLPYQQVARLRKTRERMQKSLDELSRFRRGNKALVAGVRKARPLKDETREPDAILKQVRTLLEESKVAKTK